MKSWIGAFAAGALLACGTNAHAAAGYGLDQVSTERLKDASKIAPLQIDGAFGDRTALYNGALSFENVDLSLPGHGPAVEFRRSLAITDNPFPGDIGGMGNWSVEVPSISGVFTDPYGWTVKGPNPQARCSSGNTPVDTAGFFVTDYWDGNTLSVPGLINEKVLLNRSHNRPQPTNGVTYPWTTKSAWLISCKTVAGNEVFVATSPDGVRYHMERSVARDYADLAHENAVYSWDGSSWRGGSIARSRIHYVATLVEDRHGNTVTYSYDANGRPIEIKGSDGRLITIDYAGTDKVQSVTAAGRTYRYRYTGNDLTQVDRPDGSTWTYSSGKPVPITHRFDFEIPDPTDCRAPDFDPAGFVYVVKNPSNAEARFELQVVRHRRQNVPEQCIWADGGGGAKPSHWRVPLYSDTYTLVRKDISGPGVPAGAWTYQYPGLTLPNGFRATCESQTPSPCPLTKKVIVTGPETYEVHEFGIWWEVNDGQLISRTVGRDANSTLVKTINRYVSEQEAASLPFGVLAGLGNGAYYDELNDRQRPVKETKIEQQGVTFTTLTNSWDVFARPLSVTRSSTIRGVPARTDVTAYHDNLNLWVTGQVASVTNMDMSPAKVLERTVYNAKAMPEQVFGPRNVGSSAPEVPEQTIQYNSEGTVKSVADGLGNTTQYSSWMRGVPQVIQLPVTPEKPSGASILSLVAPDGNITWVQGEGGDKTCYMYDEMGRTKSITYTSETAASPTCDTSAWNQTTQSFVQSTGTAYGLPANHWQQTIATGDARTVVYFDGFWRPVVERTYSVKAGDATPTFVVKRYDGEGRLIFQSYPMATLTDYRSTTLKGVHTAYDALGRALTVTQDSELGALVSTTQYGSGFTVKVTNPNSESTTTGFFAQGAPSTDKPAWIDQPEGVSTTIERDVLGNPTAISRSGPGG